MKKKTSKKSSLRKTASSRRHRKSTKGNDYSNRILNCIPSFDTQNDWGYGDALAAGLAAADSIPSSKDLRENWWNIGDQKSTGSCVGWATADSVLRWHFVKDGRLQKTRPLSTRFTWMASKETDIYSSRPTTFIESDGTSLKAALDISRKFGAVPDDILPFATGRLYQGDTHVFYAIASEYKIKRYINLGGNTQEWRKWLANNGPILTRLNIDDAWRNASLTNGELDTYDSATAHGGHAIALVGYTSNSFIARNSWGDGWGSGGFAFASESYARDAFTEAYGVAV